jgi:glycosyltransferase involved in cell wall biosynthesis
VAYSVLERYGAGYHCEMAPQAIAAEIERIAALPVEETNAVAENARAAAKDYDFPVLTERLIQVIEGVL